MQKSQELITAASTAVSARANAKLEAAARYRQHVTEKIEQLKLEEFKTPADIPELRTKLRNAKDNTVVIFLLSTLLIVSGKLFSSAFMPLASSAVSIASVVADYGYSLVFVACTLATVAAGSQVLRYAIAIGSHAPREAATEILQEVKDLSVQAVTKIKPYAISAIKQAPHYTMSVAMQLPKHARTFGTYLSDHKPKAQDVQTYLYNITGSPSPSVTLKEIADNVSPVKDTSLEKTPEHDTKNLSDSEIDGFGMIYLPGDSEDEQSPVANKALKLLG